VLYSDEGLVLGGGIIDEAIPDENIEENRPAASD
jgi:hypothetical protein